ncbi:MAG: hypothetical protein EB166_00390 [Thaumarchaeota archaeon]|nr:hypothetical protein [Nitrososphaerota archaeon]NDF26026.1 hypothetical protein [Nitrosopumilaceae archaeon]
MGKIRCLQCGMVLESKSIHDFQQCSCPNSTFVDGGDQYLRYGGKDPKQIKIIDDVSRKTV